MLSPDMIVRLRTTLQSDPSLTAIDNCNLKTATVGIVSPSGSSTREAGSLYPPERIFGVPVDQSCLNGIHAATLRAPSEVHRLFTNSKVIGNSAILTEDGRLFLSDDLTSDHARRLPNSNHQGFLAIPDSNGLKLYFRSRVAPKTINKTALFLHNLEGGNFGSFLIRQLSQLFYWRRQNIQFDCYISPERSSWLQEAVELVGLPKKPIFTNREIAGEIFSAIYALNNVEIEGFFPQDTLFDVHWLVDRVASPIGGFNRHRKLYVSRSLSALYRPRYRVMRNEDEVEQHMIGKGFEVVYPEILSLQQQIATFAQASHIIGPSGSGMINTIFAPAGCRIVDIETFTNTVRQHAKVYASAQHTYSFLFIKPDENDPQHIIQRGSTMPLDLLNEAVDWLLERD